MNLTNADLFRQASDQLKQEGRGTMQTNPNLIADRNQLISQMRGSQPAVQQEPQTRELLSQPKNTQSTVGMPNVVPSFNQYLGSAGAGADMSVQNMARQQYEQQFRGMAPGQSMDTTTATGAPTSLTNAMTSSADIGRATGEDFTNVFNTAGFQEGQRRFDDIVGQRDASLDRMMDFQTQNQNLQADTFKRLFGEGSRLDTFFSPTIRAVEQNILDTSQSLSRLDKDITDRFGGGTLTEAQRRKLQQQERDQLSTTLSDLTFAKERLNVDRDFEVGMAEREMQAITRDYENFLQALDTDMRERGMPEQAINFLEQAVAQDYAMQMQRLQEQQQIAEERRMEAQMKAQPDLQLSQSTGFMTNAYGQYMLDKDGNMIPFVGEQEAWQLLERGGVTYLFNPGTRELEVVAGAPGAAGDGDGLGSISGVPPEIAAMDVAQLIFKLRQDYGDDELKRITGKGNMQEAIREASSSARVQNQIRQMLAMTITSHQAAEGQIQAIASLAEEINRSMPSATRSQKAQALTQAAQKQGLPLDPQMANQYFQGDFSAILKGATDIVGGQVQRGTDILRKIPRVDRLIEGGGHLLEDLRQRGLQ